MEKASDSGKEGSLGSSENLVGLRVNLKCFDRCRVETGTCDHDCIFK